jgi:hypothetical protein
MQYLIVLRNSECRGDKGKIPIYYGGRKIREISGSKVLFDTIDASEGFSKIQRSEESSRLHDDIPYPSRGLCLHSITIRPKFKTMQ